MIDQPQVPPTVDLKDLGKNLGDFIYQILVKGAYGQIVAEVLGLAFALEQAIDGLLAAALARDDEWAVEVFTREVLGQIGRERKIAILPKILTRMPVAEPSRLIEKVRNLFKLRDRLAHGSLVYDGGDREGLQISGYRRGVAGTSVVELGEVETMLKEAKEALTELLISPIMADSRPANGA